MGNRKSKLKKSVLNELCAQTQRTPEEIKHMYSIFKQHYPNGRIESQEDLYRCLQKFSIVPFGTNDEAAKYRLYRLFQPFDQQRSIDFYRYLMTSHILERGNPQQKISLYFQSFDVNGDQMITRDDLEACMPHTVESQTLIQQLLREWDMNHDGFVNYEDFSNYLMTHPTLSVVFTGAKGRLRMDSVTLETSTDDSPTVYQVNPHRTSVNVTN